MLLLTILQNSYFWLGSLLVCLFYYHLSRWNLYRKAYNLPGPLALPLIGNCYMVLATGVSDVFPVLDKVISRESTGVVRFWLGSELVLFIKDPAIAIQVNQQTLYKAHEYAYLGKPFLSKGILTTNDLVHWKKSRRPFLLALTTENLTSFVPKFHAQLSRLMDTFQACAASKEDVFTSPLFETFTFATIVNCTMGFDVHTKSEHENRDFLHALETILEFFQLRMLIPVYRYEFIYSLLGQKAKETKAINTMKDYLKCVVAQYRRTMAKKALDFEYEDRKNCNKGKPFIEHLLEEEPPIVEDEMLGNLAMMVLGGSDTLVTEYTMLLVLLAQNPDVQQKLYDEVIQVLGPDWRICPSVEDLHKLAYLDRVVKETLRMFPAGPIVGRRVEEDITVTATGGEKYEFPSGCTTALVISNIHYNPVYYENPRVFDPDRWLPENVAKRHPSCFLPFSSGPRNCVGGRYAMLQIRTALSTLVRRFVFETSECCRNFDDINVVWSLTAKISEDCRVKFRERTKMAA